MRSFYNNGRFPIASKMEDYQLSCPFYLVVTFQTRTDYTPPYDYHDKGEYSSDTVPDTTTYILKNKLELQKFVEEISKTDTKFIFYKIEKLGKLEVKTEVNLDV